MDTIIYHCHSQAGGKQFNDWYRLNTTKNLVEELSFNTGIPVLNLIDVKKGYIIVIIPENWTDDIFGEEI